MRRPFPLVAACLLVLAACAGQDGAVTVDDPGPAPGAAAGTPGGSAGDTPATDPGDVPGEAATEPGDPEPRGDDGEPSTPEALAFSAPLLGGGTFEGGDHDGRDVALWFWAPW